LIPETVKAVVEAYGKAEACEVVATKYPAVAKLPNKDEPSTAKAAPGVIVPMPTLPDERIVNLAVFEGPIISEFATEFVMPPPNA
jgi:hypothetical protein